MVLMTKQNFVSVFVFINIRVQSLKSKLVKLLVVLIVKARSFLDVANINQSTNNVMCNLLVI